MTRAETNTGGTGDGGGGGTGGASLTQQVSSGFAWMVAQALGSKLANMIGSVVLAWLLAKEDFGLIALAYTATAFAALAQQGGQREVLIQRQAHFMRWANPAFWMGLTFGGAGMVVMAVAAPIAALVFHEGRLIPLILILAISAPLDALAIVPYARLQTQLRFRTLAMVGVTTAFVSLGLTVLFASPWLHFGAFAFVLPRPICSVITLVCYWRAAPVRIHRRLQFRRWKHMFRDSGYITGIAVMNTITMYGDNLMLGLLCSEVVLGSYYFAFNLSIQTVQLVLSSLQSALFPALSKMGGDPVRQTLAYLRATRAMGLIACYGCFLQTVLCGPLLRLAFGGKWNDAIPIMQVLSVAMAINAMYGPTGSLYQGQGRFRTLFVCSGVVSGTFLAAVGLGAGWGQGLGVAIGSCLVSAVTGPMLCYMGIRSGGGRWIDVLRLFGFPAGFGLAVFAVPMALELWLPRSAFRDVLLALVTPPLTLAVYAGLIRFFAKGTWDEIVQRLHAATARFRRPAAGKPMSVLMA